MPDVPWEGGGPSELAGKKFRLPDIEIAENGTKKLEFKTATPESKTIISHTISVSNALSDPDPI